MIDRDLAELYGVETRSINQFEKPNTERFPLGLFKGKNDGSFF